DGSVPGAPGWRWIPTPGHSPGHISLFRESDRTLLSGDALTTQKQESLVGAATARRELHGPPAWFTEDWEQARESAGRLAALAPGPLASGHGDAWSGSEMRRARRALAARFDDRERPRFGRYVRHPAVTDERGIVRLPVDPLPKIVAATAVVVGLAWMIAAV